MKITVPYILNPLGEKIAIVGDTDSLGWKLKRAGFRNEGEYWVTENLDKELIKKYIPQGELLLKEWDWRNSLQTIQNRFPFLYGYQMGIVSLGKYRDLIIALEMGLGKTIVALAMKEIYEPDSFALIVAPKSCLFQWEEEIKSKFNRESIIVKSTKDYFKRPYTLVSYQKLNLDYQDIEYPENLVLICDEASYFKNLETETYETIFYICNRAKRKYFLTGTPIENSLIELFNLLALINPDLDILQPEYFDDNFYDHPEKIPAGYWGFLIRLRKELVEICLPELIVENRIVESTKEQKKFLKSLNGNPLARLVKAREAVDLPSLVGVHSRNPKIEELEIVLEETGLDKIIVFTQFAKVAEYISDKLKDSYLLTGESSMEEREKVIEEFKSKGRVLVCSDILAHGLNLQFVDCLINYDLPFNPAKLKQRIGRIYRIGSESTKLVVNIINEDIDMWILKNIVEKEKIFDFFIERGRERWKDTKKLEAILKRSIGILRNLGKEGL